MAAAKGSRFANHDAIEACHFSGCAARDRSPFLLIVVDLDNHVSIDFFEKEGSVSRQHYAFLLSDAEFDSAFARIEERALAYWADPARTKPGEINRHDGGRGVYFEDPDGRLLELITRHYGSGTGS